MNKTSTEKRAQIIACLAEGNSIRATSRLTGVAINTVIKLLEDAGKACSAYQDKVFRNLKCSRIQCDEIWSFVYAKDKNVPEEMRGKNGVGSVWTWTALCPDTKLVPSFMLGLRDPETGRRFMEDLASRVAGRVQLTSDGLKVYLTASAACRAQRRYKQLISKGINATLPSLRADLEARDARDSSRPVAPLKPAQDARLLDNSDLTIEESVDLVLNWWQGKQSFKSA